MVPVVVTYLSLGSTLQFQLHIVDYSGIMQDIFGFVTEKQTHLKTLVVGLQTNTGSAAKCLEVPWKREILRRRVHDIDIIVSLGTGTAATSTAPREIWPSCYATP